MKSNRHGSRSGADWAQAPADPFSPRNQWLLKVLLLPGLDRRLWGGPARPPARPSRFVNDREAPPKPPPLVYTTGKA